MFIKNKNQTFGNLKKLSNKYINFIGTCNWKYLVMRKMVHEKNTIY